MNEDLVVEIYGRFYPGDIVTSIASHGYVMLYKDDNISGLDAQYSGTAEGPLMVVSHVTIDDEELAFLISSNGVMGWASTYAIKAC